MSKSKQIKVKDKLMEEEEAKCEELTKMDDSNTNKKQKILNLTLLSIFICLCVCVEGGLLCAWGGWWWDFMEGNGIL